MASRNGRMYTVYANGCVTMIADDAGPLIGNGWQSVDQARGALVSDWNNAQKINSDRLRAK